MLISFVNSEFQRKKRVKGSSKKGNSLTNPNLDSGMAPKNEGSDPHAWLMDERLGDEELVWLLSDTLGDMDGVTEADIDPEKLPEALAAAAAAVWRFRRDAAVLWTDKPDETSDIFRVVFSLKNFVKLSSKNSSAGLRGSRRKLSLKRAALAVFAQRFYRDMSGNFTDLSGYSKLHQMWTSKMKK